MKSMQSKAGAGYELFGYWEFLASQDANEKIMANFESFFSVCFPADSQLMIPHLAIRGGLRKWIEGGNTTATATYFNEEVSHILIAKN
jgi:soluble epoxide hydrolase / lipid-phosphate phosphatase